MTTIQFDFEYQSDTTYDRANLYSLKSILANLLRSKFS